jgi:hypothetical protein
MSSPQVLTFTHVPLEQARAGNREECIHYLEQAKAVRRQLEERTRQLADLGVPVEVPSRPSPEEAEQAMWSRFGADDDGSEAVRSIHHYYQDLKHPWTERVEAAERALAERSRQEQEEAAELARLRQLEVQIVQNAEARAARESAAEKAAALQITAAELSAELAARGAATSAVAKAGQWIAELGTGEKIQRQVAAIVATAGTEEEHGQLRGRIETICRADREVVVAHLEHLRLVRNREREERRRQAVEDEMRQRQAAELRVMLEASLAGCEPMLSSLPWQESGAHRAALQAALALCEQGGAARAENAFEAARQNLKVAAARRPAVIAMVRELLALGYEEITPMETITAGDINARGVSTIQLGLPADPEHLAEISFTQDGSTVAVQAVRTSPTTGTEEQRAADRAAQTAVCAHVDQVRAGAAVQVYQPEVIKREEPGKAMPVRNVKVRRGGLFVRAAAGAGQQAARMRAVSSSRP